MRRTTRTLLGALVALSTLGAAACADDSDDQNAADSEASDTPTSTGSEMADNASPQATADTVVDLAASDEQFTTLVQAIEAADLAGTLAGDGPFTGFAPVNDAFDALPAGTLDTLLQPESKPQLEAVLTYHVVPSKALSTDLRDGMKLTTVQGEDLTVGVSDGSVTLTDAAGNDVAVVAADLEADNGVVHAIDAVLMPATAS
jgi:uncharacterized surface protein with fasciclin (FAS1) repeats